MELKTRYFSFLTNSENKLTKKKCLVCTVERLKRIVLVGNANEVRKWIRCNTFNSPR